MLLFRRYIFCFLAIALLAPALARADLAGEVRAILNDKYLAKAKAGVVIAKLQDGSTKPDMRFAANGAMPLIPASNLKLITTAAALDRLGPDFKFRTHLLLKGEDLYLIGDGDPTLGDAEMLKPLGWDVTTIFMIWADELKKRNVAHVKNLYIDDSVFDEQFLHPNWPIDQEHLRYVAQVGGINLNVNCVDFIIRKSSYGQPVSVLMNPDTQYINFKNTCITGDRDAIGLVRVRGGNDVILRGQTDTSRSTPISVTVHDPPMYAATVLAETLAEAGITVGSAPVRNRSARRAFAKEGESGGWSVVGALDTPLAPVLNRANKDSVNLYAESLCKRLGFAATSQPGTWLSGTMAMGEFVRSCGVTEEQFRLDDGCGLSKENAISAEAIVRVLAREFGGKNRQMFLDSLSVSGADGTLKDRFAASVLSGRVFAKSGYVNYVGTLSGYVNTTDGSWYAFSILMNEVPFRTNNKAKELQERIVNAIEASTRK
ncbi:MAG TPA: D-alanyl-D-alanine carboxypeptidase/D-alanyl-D-alanine-endopeptidase [Tepidisphaeraceae bacterium]|nr:D-alanyl-D-alanine carboxypeptidase/D-alanyl-D-alanine-endopeptidase [Tepidisphaeraceae bacterium]